MSIDGVIAINGIESESGRSFGDKGLRLRKIAKMGLGVPDGLILSKEYLEAKIADLGLRDEIDRIIELEIRDEPSLDEKLMESFQKLGAFEKLSVIFKKELSFISDIHSDSKFAVRSAALGEDNPSFSHAGQFETRLGVRPAEVGREVLSCYSSWWSDRVSHYRKSRNISAAYPQMSVIVQRMASPDFAGVLFTRHPFDVEKNIMVVEAVKGLGDKLVSGEATPLRWEIDRNSGGAAFCSGPGDKTAEMLNTELLSRLISTGKKIEKEFGEEQDIEWAFENGRLLILQARPITTLTGKTPLPAATELGKSFNDRDIYSRSIIEDLWADRMSAITSSIVFEEFAEIFTFQQTLKRIGLDRITTPDAVKVINGYGYLNCRPAYLLLEYLPPLLRFREFEKMFPPSLRNQVLKTPFKIKKVLSLLPRIPLLFEEAAQLPFLTDVLLRKFLKKMELRLNRIPEHAYEMIPLEDLGKELERLLQIQRELQKKNQWGYGKATLYTWLLRQLSVRIGGKEDSWAMERLASIPQNVTSQCQKDLDQIASLCDERIRKIFFTCENDRVVWRTLTSDFADHPATEAMQDFLNRYRYRSANRDFIHPRWNENPEIIISMVSRRLVGRESKNESHLPKPSAISGSPEILKKKQTAFEILIKPLIHFARKFLALREDLRFGLDAVFYRIRKLLLAISRNPAFEGFGEIPQAVFFFKLNELRSVLAEETAPERWLNIVKKRRDAYIAEKDLPPAYYVEIDRISGNVRRLGHSDNAFEFLKGAPASPGVVEGAAKLIRNESDFSRLKKGDILIAFNTDPGWTPLFVDASAVVTEMGGILNHCAIIAREYRIPAVVGVESLTQKIKTGQRVRVDGNAGIIQLL